MLNLAEYRNKADRLADHLPWAALVAPGVVLNKDGSFQRTLRFRGADLESATEAELVGACARANNVLRRFGSGWALFFDAERIEALGYPEASFPDPASWLVDEERRAAFEGQRRRHFESAYHVTLLYMPPADRQDQAGRALLETGHDTKGRDWRQDLAGFIAETGRALDLLAGFMPEVRPLDDSETLSYLHSAISARRSIAARFKRKLGGFQINKGLVRCCARRAEYGLSSLSPSRPGKRSDDCHERKSEFPGTQSAEPA